MENKLDFFNVEFYRRDLNNDDTSTETESLINGFDDIRIHQHQRPSAAMVGGIGNGGGGSMRRSGKPNLPSFSKSSSHFSHLTAEAL